MKKLMLVILICLFILTNGHLGAQPVPSGSRSTCPFMLYTGPYLAALSIEGDTRYNSALHQFEVYTGSSWVSMGSGTYLNLQPSTPGTPQTGGFWVSGAGIVGPFIQNSTASYESAPLGAELLSSTGWTSTNWTGSWGLGGPIILETLPP